MRTFLGILALIASVVISYLWSKKYTERKKFFGELKSFNESVKKEVIFSRKTLLELIKKLDGETRFSRYIGAAMTNTKDAETCLTDINPAEKQFLADYIRGIGGGDAETQKKYLEVAEKDIEKFYSAATEEEKKYRPLCIKLGFLFGLIMLIILL